MTDLLRYQERLDLIEACMAELNDLVIIVAAEPDSVHGPRIVFVNSAVERCTGYGSGELIGQSPSILLGVRKEGNELKRLFSALWDQAPTCSEVISQTKQGSEFWLDINIVPIKNGRSKCSIWAVIGMDITQRRASELEISYLAYYDALTGLPNRRLLINRLEQNTKKYARSGEFGALLLIDLDNFKTLNNTYGHYKGDLLLQQVAARLATCLRRTDFLGRLGGDEFVVVLEKLGKKAEEAAKKAKSVCRKLLFALNQPFQLNGHEYISTSSIGLALFNNDRHGTEELLRRADFAMYQAKSAGRNTGRFFDPTMQAAITARCYLKDELRQGLQRKEFLLYYQPQVNIDGEVVGAEALIRWTHPQLGIVSPAEFIPLAEESGLILPLGQWVLQTACEQLAVWGENEGTAHLTVSVNVSAKEFLHHGFVEQVLGIISRTGARPKNLKLELTESLFVNDIEVVIRTMNILKSHGVCFSLDDFGTGYSSLAYLKCMPLDQIKIDQSFVADVLTSTNGASITHTIVALGNALGLNVIAEGVETIGQRDFLAGYGCTTYQGNLYGRPAPIHEFEARLNDLRSAYICILNETCIIGPHSRLACDRYSTCAKEESKCGHYRIVDKIDAHV